MISEEEKNLIIDYTYKLYGEDTEKVLNDYPIVGTNGIRKVLGEQFPDFFCKVYLGDQFEREFAEYSKTLLKTVKKVIESNSAEKQAVIMPREHGKSTFCSFAMPTWAALYKKKRFIYFISSNQDIAANFLNKIKRALENNEAIHEDFGIMQNKTNWSAEEIKLTNGVWIGCSGWQSGLRGLNKDSRPDFIGLDDLEDKKVMESASLQKKLEQCFNEEIGRLGTYNTDFFYIGTLLSETSLLAKVKEKPSWRTLEMKRVLSFPTEKGEQLWDKWRDIFRNIADDDRFKNAYSFYLKNKKEMIEGTKVLWPDKVPASKTQYKGAYYNVMLDREAYGEDAFWKEDQNEPRNSDDKHFRQLHFWQNLYNEFPKVENLKLAIDPSEGKGSDSTAYALGGTINEAVVIQQGQLHNHKLNSIIAHIAWFIENYPKIEEIIIEENSYKADGTEQIREKLVEKGYYRKVTGIRSLDTKHIRIIQMEPDVNNGLILLNKTNVNFNKQILDYHIKVKNDDAADALQMLWKNLKKPNYIFR